MPSRLKGTMAIKYDLSWPILALLLGAAVLFAPGSAAETGEKLSYDAGLVWKGDVITHRFTLPNTGADDLVIRTVRPSCSCVSIPSFPERIAPGATGDVEVHIDTKAFDGPFRYSAFVQAEEPRNLMIPLTVLGEVRSAFAVNPKRIVISEATWGISQAPQEFTVTPNAAAPFAITGVESDTPFVRTKIEREPTDDDDDYLVSVEFARNCPVGPLQATVTLLTDSPRQPTVTVPVMISVRGAIQVSPPTIALGQLDPSKLAATPTQILALQTIGHEPFHVNSVSSSPEGLFEFDIAEKEAGQSYEITVRPASLPESGSIQGTIHITTDNGGQPTIDLPVSGVIQ